MIHRVVDGYRFLAELTVAEKTLVADTTRNNRKEAEALITALREIQLA